MTRILRLSGALVALVSVFSLGSLAVHAQEVAVVGDSSATAAPLHVTCDATPNPVEVDKQVTWAAHVTGGNTYYYEWTGDGNFPGNQSGANYQTVTATYEQAGPRTAHVKVVSGQQTAEADCSVTVKAPATPPPAQLTVSCSATPNPAQPNATVTWSAQTVGGNSQDVYTWTGSDNFPGPHANTSGIGVTSVDATYANAGTKTAHVVVNSSGGRTASADCSVQVSAATGGGGGGNPPPPPPPASCDARHDLSVTAVTLNAQGRAQATFTNNTQDAGCAYNVGLSSYEAAVFWNGSNSQQFINGQTRFDDSSRRLAKGESATLSVGVPSCNYQVDAYAYQDGQQLSPVPPDFGALEGRYALFSGWLIKNVQGNECGAITQCPVGTPAPTITTNATASGTVGVSFTHDIYIQNATFAPTTAGALPTGLTFHLSGPQSSTVAHYVIDGTPTQAGTFTFNLFADNACAETPAHITITIGGGGGQCPIAPVVLAKESDAITGTVGSALSYTIQLASGGSPVTYSIASGSLPSGLSLNGNVISGTPTSATPIDTTVTIQASNQCGNDTMTLRIVTTTNVCPVSPAVITSANTASGTLNKSFSYTVTANGGQPITFSAANLPPGLSFSTSTNVISGTPTQTGDFTTVLTATNQCGTNTLNLKITIGTDNPGCTTNCGGGGGGGRTTHHGGSSRPRVTLSSSTTPEVAGAFITLDQVPYTGLGTDLLQVALFFIGLIAISGGAAYALLRRKARQGDVVIAAPHQASAVAYAAAAPVVEDDTSFMTGYEEYAAPRMEQPHSMPTPASLPVEANVEPKMPTPREVSSAMLQQEARATRTLVSDDGAALIAASAEGDEKKALERLSQVIEIAKTRFPREDGWLILDKERVRESLFISILSTVPLFIEWLMRGEDKKVFTFLRMLKYQEQPIASFMRKVVSALDTAHKARLEGSEARVAVDPHVAEVTYHLSSGELESVIDELLHGVDERYESPYTSVRLSLVRVLDMIKERALTRIGGQYAPQLQEA